MLQAPTFAHFDFCNNIIKQANASSYGLGVALMQQKRTDKEFVSYASKAMTECEKRYSQMEKEVLALVFACKQFKDYIVGINVKLKTDHKLLL